MKRLALLLLGTGLIAGALSMALWLPKPMQALIQKLTDEQKSIGMAVLLGVGALLVVHMIFDNLKVAIPIALLIAALGALAVLESARIKTKAIASCTKLTVSSGATPEGGHALCRCVVTVAISSGMALKDIRALIIVLAGGRVPEGSAGLDRFSANIRKECADAVPESVRNLAD